MESQIIVGVVTAVLVFLGTWLTFRGTKGRTQSDYTTAMEARIDGKVESYAKKAEERAEKYEAKYDELDSKYDELADQYRELKRDQDLSTRRESILFRYIASLREHVVLQLPPPPPSIPPELEDWFEDLEATAPRGTA